MNLVRKSRPSLLKPHVIVNQSCPENMKVPEHNLSRYILVVTNIECTHTHVLSKICLSAPIASSFHPRNAKRCHHVGNQDKRT